MEIFDNSGHPLLVCTWQASKPRSVQGLIITEDLKIEEREQPHTHKRSTCIMEPWTVTYNGMGMEDNLWLKSCAYIWHSPSVSLSWVSMVSILFMSSLFVSASSSLSFLTELRWSCKFATCTCRHACVGREHVISMWLKRLIVGVHLHGGWGCDQSCDLKGWSWVCICMGGEDVISHVT